MKKFFLLATLLAFCVTQLPANEYSKNFMNGTPEIQSMSALTFGPPGILFISDAKNAAVFAVELGDQTPNTSTEKLEIKNIEEKIASLLGTTASEVLIHDLAVNPISKNAYSAVSRGRSNWSSAWQLPNDLEDAKVLLKITPDGQFEEVSLQNIRYSQAEIPNPINAEEKHRWKHISKRVDAITDIAYDDGKVYVAGLSNEEFASSLRVLSFPFEKAASATTLEIYHAAHGKYETHAPIRTFLPYKINNESQLLASYLCTPLVTFPVASLQNGTHLKGKTVAELGYGNYPLDMIAYKKGGKEYILIANTRRPLMRIDPADIAKQHDGLTTPIPDDGVTAGVPYKPLPSSGIQQIDNFNDEFVLALQRNPGGTLDLVSLSVKWL